MTRLRFFLSRRNSADFDKELEFHLEQSTHANIVAGMAPREARRQALFAFRGIERTREDCHEQRPGWLLESVPQDVHYSLRGFGRNPVFIVAVVAILALGISATTAVFSVVDRRPRKLKYPHSQKENPNVRLYK